MMTYSSDSPLSPLRNHHALPLPSRRVSESGAANPFSAAAFTAQLIDRAASVASGDSIQGGPLARSLASAPNLATAWNSLSVVQQEQIRSRIGAQALSELLDLSCETDPSMFAEGLFAFGIRQERADHLDS